MLKTDKDALVCDFAETYGVFDLGSLPVKTVAALAFGLGDSSRIKMKMAGLKVPTNTLLLAHIADSLSYIKWTKTQAAVDAPNKPPRRLVNDLLGIGQPEDAGTCKGFESADAFEAAREKILRSKG